jgi:uncharacterized Zn-binding protein involved in type VI secretion
MGQPIAVTDGIAFAFPNICLTPAGPATVPIPYPSIAQLADAKDASTDVLAGGKGVILEGKTKVETTSGDEAGTGMGVPSGTQGKECTFTKGSSTVKVNGAAVVRLGDPTQQNKNNAIGTVLAGLATVLVGG